MKPGYTLKSGFEHMDTTEIHRNISQLYWAKGIPLDTLITALKNSLCFGVFTDQHQQVGFARVITDRASFAYLADVYITAEHRGRGLSKALMDAIVNAQELQGLRRFLLATKDAHDLYRQFGFQPLAHPDTFMEVWRPDIYTG